jgi:hypothetical protein
MNRASWTGIGDPFSAIRRVERLLKKVTTALNERRRALRGGGGYAVAAWVASVDEEAIRFTNDVDILARRTDFPALSAALRNVGLDEAEVLGVTMFVDRKHPSPMSGVQVVFANEKIRAHYTQAAPDLDRVKRDLRPYPVVDFVDLVTMKLQSFRIVDQNHLMDLKAVELLDERMLDRVPAEFRDRLQHILDTPE